MKRTPKSIADMLAGAPAAKLEIPSAFESLEAEAEWFDAHLDELGELLKRHGKRLSEVAPELHKALKPKTRALSIRVPESDIELAQQLAAKLDKGYQTVMNEALHEGLRRMRKRMLVA
jgi:predicted DNA binding CopG/RHH family protein